MEKRKSYRDRFFEDNEYVKEPANNIRGYRIRLNYTGRWVSYIGRSYSLRTYKFLMIIAEILSILIYFISAVRDVEVNEVMLSAGFGTLSIIPWIVEIYEVVRFAFTGDKVKALTSDEITGGLRIACWSRVILLVISAIVSLFAVIFFGGFTLSCGISTAGIIVSGLLSLFIYKIYNSLLIQ